MGASEKHLKEEKKMGDVISIGSTTKILVFCH